ncbi:hypothetical protein [Amycolatopsis sp. NPDC049159]|uniref:hypothetical protein n=1 Tax=Amycolatopsis sp. NPDC049159 TaxID=3157210 RepID=UPI0033DF49D3
MSEYQYYRARIRATSFVNEYDWGDFKGDPRHLMERYYDAHLYSASWGSHRLMFRLPLDSLDPDVVEDCCVGAGVSAWTTGEYIVLDFASEDDVGEFDFEYDAETLLSAIVGVRAELASGDFRPLYLAWLAACGAGERDEDGFGREADKDLEPPSPPGLGTLSAAQRALADFLRLDDDLLATAAEASPPLEHTADDSGDLAIRVSRLPADERTGSWSGSRWVKPGGCGGSCCAGVATSPLRLSPCRTVGPWLTCSTPRRAGGLASDDSIGLPRREPPRGRVLTH